VRYMGQTYHPYAMTYENTAIYLCRHPIVSLQEAWPDFKNWR